MVLFVVIYLGVGLIACFLLGFTDGSVELHDLLVLALAWPAVGVYILASILQDLYRSLSK